MSSSGAATRDRRGRKLPPQSTYISPTTGERIKRVFSLRDASHRLNNGSPTSERQPLLPRNIPKQDDSWLGKTKQYVSARGASAWKFAKSSTGQGVLKCSLAYTIASLATFVPAISSLIGKADSKHVVCTVTVYFSPARTIGSMHEAVILALIGFCYAAFISFTSMGVSMFFGQRDLLQVGHAIVLIVFCGGGMGFIAWTKQHFGHPLVNVACSLASLACVSVLVKEGTVQAGEFSDDRVVQILIMVIMGIFVTTMVNLIVLPIKARRRLHKDLVKDTELLGEMLVNTTRAFLVGEEDILKEGNKIAKDHQSTATSMQKNLVEAQREHFLLGSEKQYHIEAKLVRCLGRLSQNLGGLRSAASTQFAILRKSLDQTIGIDRTPFSWSVGTNTPNKSRAGSVSRSGLLDVINEDSEESDERPSTSNTWDGATTPSRLRSGMSFLDIVWEGTAKSGASTPANDLLAPADMFVTFIDQLGPPAKSLVFTLKQMLDELQFARNGTVSFDERFHANLSAAIELYTNSRKEALETLYRSKSLSGPRPVEVLADLEEVAASCGHFSFSLLDLAEGCLVYLDLLEQLHAEIERSPKRRTWYWLMFWRPSESNDEQPRTFGTFQPEAEVGPVNNIPASIKRADSYVNLDKLTPERPWTFAIYRAMSVFRRDDVHFAIKVGAGAALYALPAFLPETRPFFSHWRGEWGLISYMVVCSMTIGASNTTGWERLLGTLIGACCAVVAWLISADHGDANPWILGFLGWIMSLWCFYLINAKGKGPMGRFILLTYNLGALYAYSLSVRDDDHDEDEGGVDPAIWEIVIHRVVSVIVGVIWGIVVTRLIWPISARQKLKDGLCILWLRMCLIWKRDPLAIYLLGEPKSNYMDIRELAELQSFLNFLDSLRKAAASEFELRGPFPDKITGRIVERTRAMLDSFHAMNVVMTRNAQVTAGEAAILRYTREERFALSARISHLFSVLASSFKLEYPLNDVLPNIEDRRDRLLTKIFEFRRNDTEATEADYELLYAYVLVTGQLADDLQEVIHEIETLFGTLDEESLKLQ